mmetsp:Transcript_1408/g.4124  ORF Transcript_1408/g.4124 Transcript_1408/m.4124 type:complete len:291 (+) Transcript_1408:1156-2028(+)
MGARQAERDHCHWILGERNFGPRPEERARRRDLGRRAEGLRAIHDQVHLLLGALGLQPDLGVHPQTQGQRRRPDARRGVGDGQDALQAPGGVPRAQRLRAPELPDHRPARAPGPLHGRRRAARGGGQRLQARPDGGLRPAAGGLHRLQGPAHARGARLPHHAERLQGRAVPALHLPPRPGRARPRPARDLRRRGGRGRLPLGLRLRAGEPQQAGPEHHLAGLPGHGPRRGLRGAHGDRADQEPAGRTDPSEPGGCGGEGGKALQSSLHLPAARVRPPRVGRGRADLHLPV